jgi:hypothetical protein
MALAGSVFGIVEGAATEAVGCKSTWATIIACDGNNANQLWEKVDTATAGQFTLRPKRADGATAPSPYCLAGFGAASKPGGVNA